MFYIIYKTTHVPTGCYYIGKHNQEIDPYVFDGYYGSGVLLKKLDKKDLVRKTICVLESEEECFLKEKEIVTKELLKDPKCLNVLPGGLGIHDCYKAMDCLKDRKWMYNEEIGVETRVSGEYVEYYKTKGFKLGRSKKSRESVSKAMIGNLIWVHLGETETQISKDLLDYYLEKGYELGRNPDQGRKLHEYSTGSIMVYKGDQTKRISEKELDLYYSKGWKRGSPKSGEATKDKIAISNPKTMELKYIKEKDFHLYDGWIKGNLKKRRG